MCGILGFVSDDIRNPADFWLFADTLFALSRSRGGQASGFAAIGNKSTFVTDKAPVSSDILVRQNKAWRSLRGFKSISLIGHTRQATSGSPAINTNNHPFHGQRYSLAHNGGISAHRLIAETKGYKLATDCDSEILLHLIEDKDTISDGVTHMFQYADPLGWMAVCALERESGVVHLTKDGHSPCYVVSLPKWNAIAFSSEMRMLRESVEEVVGKNRMDDYIAPITLNGVKPYSLFSINTDLTVTEKELADEVKAGLVNLRGTKDSVVVNPAWSGGRSVYDSDRIPRIGYTSTSTNMEDTQVIGFRVLDDDGVDTTESDDIPGEWHQCPGCSEYTDLKDDDEFCEDCIEKRERHQEVEKLAQEAQEALKTPVHVEEPEAEVKEEKVVYPCKEPIFHRYDTACSFRDPNPTFTAKDTDTFKALMALSWKDKTAIWSKMTKIKAGRLENGQWKAFLNYVRDFHEYQKKAASTAFQMGKFHGVD